MGLAFDRDDCLVQHVPPGGRRLEVTGSMGGGDRRLEVRPAIVGQGRVGSRGHPGSDLELAQSLAGNPGLRPACCQQRLDRAGEPDWAGGEFGVRSWELVPLAPLSDQARICIECASDLCDAVDLHEASLFFCRYSRQNTRSVVTPDRLTGACRRAAYVPLVPRTERA